MKTVPTDSWFLQYIHYPKLERLEKFYAKYGTLMHEILEKYYGGKATKNDALVMFMTKFNGLRDLRGVPQSGTVLKYYNAGIGFLKNLEQMPFETVDIEKKIDFVIGDRKCTCRIDYVGLEDGEYVIVDNKSRDLKPRSKRKKPTLNDLEIDKMLRQLYIYSEAVFQAYGRYPKWLCFNCFKNGTFIKEPFYTQIFEETKAWFLETIDVISNVDDFYPNCEFFQCNYLCPYEEHCCYREAEKPSRGKHY